MYHRVHVCVEIWLLRSAAQGISNTNRSLGSGCDSVARVVASDTRDPRFESSHWQMLFTLNCIKTRVEKTKIKEKEAGIGTNRSCPKPKKVSYFQISFQSSAYGHNPIERFTHWILFLLKRHTQASHSSVTLNRHTQSMAIRDVTSFGCYFHSP